MPQSLWPRWRVSACGTSRSLTPVSGSTLVAAQRAMRLTTFSRARRPTPSSLPTRSSSHQAGQLETYRLPLNGLQFLNQLQVCLGRLQPRHERVLGRVLGGQQNDPAWNNARCTVRPFAPGGRTGDVLAMNLRLADLRRSSD